MSNAPSRLLSVAGVLAGTAAVLGLAAAPASAKTTTLHFFQKSTGQTVTGPNGKPAPPPGPTSLPKVGERIVDTDVDYAGNHSRHAARPSATDRLTCVFVSARGVARCNGEITIGRSMLLVKNETVDLAENADIPINGGTGAYAHARGTTKSVSIANTSNSDFTVTFTV